MLQDWDQIQRSHGFLIFCQFYLASIAGVQMTFLMDLAHFGFHMVPCWVKGVYNPVFLVHVRDGSCRAIVFVHRTGGMFPYREKLQRLSHWVWCGVFALRPDMSSSFKQYLPCHSFSPPTRNQAHPPIARLAGSDFVIHARAGVGF